MTEPDMDKYVLGLPTQLRHIFRLIRDIYQDQETFAVEALLIPDLYKVFYEHAKSTQKNRGGR